MKKPKKYPLKKEIINGVVAKFQKRKPGIVYSESALYIDLIEFVQAGQPGFALLRYFSDRKVPSRKNIERAMRLDLQDSGATEGLREFLCHYAFQIGYAATLMQFEISDEEEIAKKLKTHPTARLADRMVSEFHMTRSNINTGFDQTISRMEKILEAVNSSKANNVKNKEISRYLQLFWKSVDGQDIEGMGSALQSLTDHFEIAISTAMFHQSYFVNERIKLLIQEGLYEDAIEAATTFRKREPFIFPINYHAALAYYESHEYKKAINILLHNLSKDACEAESLFLLARCYSLAHETDNALGAYAAALNLYGEGKLLRATDRFCFKEHKILTSKTPVEHDFYRMLLWEYTFEQVQNKADKNTIAKLIEALKSEQDQYSLRADLLEKKDDKHLMEYCQNLVLTHDDNPYLLTQLIIFQIQSSSPLENILPNIQALWRLNKPWCKRLFLRNESFRSLIGNKTIDDLLAE